MSTPPDMRKSCMNCPSLLIQGSDQANILNKDLGAPVCSRYGKVIGSRNSSANERMKIGEVYAKTCTSYGEDKLLRANWSDMELRVVMPDPDAILSTDQRVSPDAVTACRSCSNFIREDVVFTELGYNTAVCAAKGKMLLPQRLTREAENCDYSSFGMVRTNITGLTMLPEYTQAVRGHADPLQNHLIQKKREVIEPHLYPTDRPVSDEDKACGIRAWRSIYDPASENEVFLPIFDMDFFSEEERAKIPKAGDEEHPEDYVDHNFYLYQIAVLWQELDETPGVWGQPGTGKTEIFRYLAYLMCLPFERFSISARTELEDLAGKAQFKPDEGTYFEPGRFVRAYQKPCICVIDEPNAGPDEVWHFFRPLFDNSKQLVLDQDDGQARKRDDNCYIGLAMNPAWDAKNSGIKGIADADARRLHHMFFDLPPAEIEKDIIRTRVAHDGWEITDEQLDLIVGIGDDIRSLVKEDTIPISWGIAMQLKVARLVRWFDWKRAYRLAAGDFLEPEALELLISTVGTHVDR